MGQGTIIILCYVGIVLSIFLGHKTSINIGIPSAILALIIGCFCMGMSSSAVINLFPFTLSFQLIAINLLFGFAIQNKTLIALSNIMIYKVRNRAYLLPFALYLVGLLLGVMGTSTPVIISVTSIIGYSVGIAANINPVILCVACCHGSALGSLVPWGTSGILVSGLSEETGFADSIAAAPFALPLSAWLLSFVILLVAFFLFGGTKLKNVEIDKPEPLSDIQKKTLVVIGIVVAFLLVPAILSNFVSFPLLSIIKSKVNIQLLSLIGFLVCALLKLGDDKAVIKSAPWGTLITVGGLMMLMSVAAEAGATDLIASFLSSEVSGFLVAPLIALLSGLLSVFAAYSSIYTMLVPVIAAICTNTGMSYVGLTIACLLGAIYSSVSPFSTGGSFMLANCPDEELRGRVFNVEIILAVAGILVIMAASNLFVMIF